MRKKVIFFLALVIFMLLGYNYLYQNHRDISEEKPDFSVTSKNIAIEFSNESQLSEQKYIDKIIVVSGTITELNELDLTLDDAVFCQLKNNINGDIKVGDQLALKGRCIGFDDLFEQVKLNECSVIN